MRCAKREPTGVARCVALSSLAVMVYTELSKPTPHPAVESAFDVILLALKVKTNIRKTSPFCLGIMIIYLKLVL